MKHMVFPPGQNRLLQQTLLDSYLLFCDSEAQSRGTKPPKKQCELRLECEFGLSLKAQCGVLLMLLASPPYVGTLPGFLSLVSEFLQQRV